MSAPNACAHCTLGSGSCSIHKLQRLEADQVGSTPCMVRRVASRAAACAAMSDGTSEKRKEMPST